MAVRPRQRECNCWAHEYSKTELGNVRGSKFCFALCLSRSFSFRLTSSSTSFPSSSKKPPLELTIFDRSYSKYLPNLESRFNGLDTLDVVGEFDVAGVTPMGRLLFVLGIADVEASCSLSR